MGKMKAKFRKGNLRSRTLIVTLLFAVFLTAVGSITALAAPWDSAKFSVKVAGTDKQSGMVTASLSETINFQSDKVFVGGNDMSRVYALVISSTNIGGEQGDSPVQLLLNDPDPKRWRWLEDTGNSLRLKYTVPTGTPLDATTFNSIMSSLSAVYNPNKNQAYAEGTITIEAYTRSNWSWQETLITKPYKNYSCKLLFYNYAEGRTDEDSAVMDYKSDYAASYDSKYEDDVPDAAEAVGLLVDSPDEANGKAEFDLYLTQKATTLDPKDDKNYANIGKQADVGYQVKESTEVWTSSVATVYTNHYELADVDITQPIHMTVGNLKSGVTYNIRGVVATDGKKSTPKYTSELTFTYRKPTINSFNIGGVTKVYQGGKDKMNLSMRATFNDANAIGETYTGIDGIVRDGPAMKADIYFTSNRVFQEVPSADGTGTVQEDHSKWYRILKNSDGSNASFTKTMTDQETGEVSNAFTNNWLNFTVPSSLHDISDYASTNEINSTTCAFKLVITDLYTGYTSVMYSDCFTIDAGAPSAPTVKATSGGVEKNLDLGSATVVGGTSDDGSAQVKIEIGNSDDHGGSGIKQYSYSMYYLPTDKVPNTMHTTAEVLNMLKNYTPTSYGSCEYKSWSPLSAKLNEDGSEAENVSELIVSKDGYYRIIARAEDEAGFTSETVEGYFRVDLTPPATPTARLAKKENGSFKPYDNRTYTDSDVWAFAYSEPQTGKSLSSFKFSTNGGLTWTDINTIENSKKMVSLGNTSVTVPTYIDDTCTSTQNYVYQVGIDLSALGYSDYVSLLFKAVDTLGNESLVSNEVHMRTSSQVTTVATLSHDPIEVAMAVGNTYMTPENNLKPLKIRAAHMVNEKYYGTTGQGTNINGANFNPYLYTKSHTCTYADDSATGACTQGASCPYNIVENAGYAIYKPEWINISGISSGEGSQKITDWLPYDHNTNPSNSTDTIDLGPNGYVQYYSDRHASGNGNNGERITSPGYGEPNSGCMQRKRHIIDMSSSKDWSEILFAGVSVNAESDWLFHHFDQPTKKSIIFTMNTAACNFHTYKQSGFWFNTTIRKSEKSNEWVVSGYRLMIVYGSGSWKLTDGIGTASNCSLQIQKFTDQPVKALSDSGGTLLGSTVATANLSGNGAAIQNFMIDLDGSSVTVYKVEGALSSSQLTKEFFRATTPVSGLTGIAIDRPTVDGFTIGEPKQVIGGVTNPYGGDTDCYGFGPVIGYSSHSCDRETRVTFSNITLYWNTAKTLSEVVTEPSWGNGKARFILNITNDSEKDFNDPILSAQVQWRLNNDVARYIGWGDSTQRSTVMSFLGRMAGSGASADELAKYGMYENIANVKQAMGTAQEFTDIATYITQQYFMELGFNTASGPIKDQVSPAGGVQKGVAYTQDNIGNIHFAVNPPGLGISSANPDFPSGRWYMEHDITGMGTVRDPRSGQYTDALETNVTLPGRYTFYFAPPAAAVNSNTLDPGTAVFDFVVNQKPVAQFTASIVNQSGTKVLQIADVSYDPDCPSGSTSVGGVQLSGIVKREWKYQFLTKNGDNLVVSRESPWSTTSLNGRTLNSLTGYNDMPSGTVLTIYERVTDTATRRVANKDASGNVTGYRYVTTNGAVSDVCQVNATEGVVITYAPQSVMSMEPTIMYDTASDAASTHRSIKVTRLSTHPQGNFFTPSFAINLTDVGIEGANKDTGYTPLTKSGNNYYYGGQLVLKCVTAPTATGNIGNGETGSKGGVWEIPYSFISARGQLGKYIKIQLTERTYGLSAANAALGKTDKDYIPDQSARSVLYKKDTSAPTAQVVTTATEITGETELKEYEANNYLDVTNNDKFVIINVGGSEDKEGTLKGYGYYFYETNSSGTENSWYRMNGDGSLTGVSSAKAALQRLSPSGGQIRIGKSSMRKTPTDSLNIAIFAYDNQTGVNNETGANQTAKTKIKDIKLTISKPVPPAISVTNTMNQNVASIGNDRGFYDSTGADSQTTSLNNYSATNVTVSFAPRKAKYSPNSSGELVLDEARGQEYYQDFYKKADLTGVANVRYSVKYKATESESWWTKEQLEQAAMSEIVTDKVIPSAQTLTFTEDGVYEVTAAVINGSGTVSATRTVKYTIDKTAPEGLQVTFANLNDNSDYTSSSWSKGVKIVASGATDTNAITAKYQYTTDGGKTWIDMGMLTNPSTSVDITKSGKYTVQVRAIDLAGNETVFPQTVIVCVDTTAPVTNGPTLTASSTMRDIYDSYVISLKYDDAGGKVYSILNDGVVNTLDKEVAVPIDQENSTATETVYGDVVFELHPAEGHIIGQVVYKGEDITDQVQQGANQNVYYLSIDRVSEDAILSVTFPETELEPEVYRSVSRATFAMSSATAMTFNSLKPDQGVSTAADEGEGSGSDGGESGEMPDPGSGVEMYTVTANSASPRGKVALSAEEVLAGGKVTLTMTPNKGCRVKSVEVNGSMIDLEDIQKQDGANVYTYELTVLQDTAIWVDFETIPTRLVRVQYNTDCGEFVTLLSDNDSVMDQGNNTYRVPVNEEIYIHMGAKQGYGTKSLLVNGEAPADFAQGASTCPYTAPEWTEEGTDPGIDIKVEFDVITTLKRTYQVSVGASAEDGNPHGTIVAAGDDVRIPVNGARTFIITPELGYKVEHLYHSYTSADNGPETVDLAEGLQPMPGTSIRQYMYTLTNPVSDGSLEVIFERQTYTLKTSSNKGGMIGITPVGGVSMTLDRIPEGASVIITPTPQDGYRVQDLIITELINNNRVGRSVGAVTSYTLSNIHANIEVEAVFVKREISRTETTHMITAVANGIKDADDALASKPYRFCIADGPRENSQSHVSAWSEWSESNTCSYTEIRDQKTGTVYPLESNQRYYVYVMARDRVGNESEPKLSTVYSMANMAAPLGAEALDDAGNSSTKSVALQIDPNGNPDGTEYLVYTSNSSSMTDMTIANADVNGGWAKLGADNRFIITGLTPGRWYHMQVVARNSDGIVSRMSDDVSSLMLSPAAPPMDSFWFEEQTSPNSPVILHWLEPSSEVTGIQIYRDGMFLAELPAGTLSYTDERNSFAADSIFKYSYAYVNSAGAGSTTTAISEEYYNAHYGSSYDEAKVEKMGNLITSTGYDQLFSETMTYPCYPDGCKEPVSASTPGGTDNSGTITVQMNYNALLSGRYQKYFLTLKAFEKEVDSEGEPVLGEDGKPIYHEVGIEKWDPTGTNRNGDGTQKWKETKVTQVMGETAARATWTNLSTLYEYNIYVEEIRSNGATSADNLGGQNGQGVEYSLGKEYVVNREGYYYRYAKDTTEPRLNTGSGSWTTEALLEYTKKNDVAGWDRPVNNNYITFNKSPSVKLATEADRYYDNDSEKVRTSTDGKQYLLVDNSMSSKTFHINVAAWDPDGAREESSVKPAVKGTISGVQGAAPEFAAGESMPKSEELATQRGNLYPVTFDGATLNTGVYNTLEMRASDSDTTTTQTTNDIRLVINRNVPSSSIVGSASKRIENKRAYSMDELVQVNSMVSSGNGSTSLSKVALLVMPNEYQTALGSSDYDTLYQQLCVTGDATVVNKAKVLLGTAATSPLYVNGSKLTEAGMNLAIARVAPPVTKYITITEEQYNSLLATVPDKVMKDVGSKTTYWLELNYALANSYCTWLQTGEGGKVVPNVELKPTDKENTYMMKLVTRFGGNPTSQTVDFVIKDAPSTQILSKKSFVWKDTAKEEYDYYKTENFTVQQIIDKYHDCYVPGETTMEDPLEGYTKETSPAFTTKTVNGQTVYLVYKLVDSEGNVGNDFISGEVRTNLGVHKQFDEVGVVLVTDAGFDPNTTALPATAIDSKVYKNDNGREPIVESGDLRFGVNGLTPGVTYWLWSYYKLPGEERVYSRGHVALTTEGNFPMAQYGFTRGTYSYKEKDYPDGRYMSFNIGKLGSVDASATVRVTPVYYAADEYGTILRNEADEPIELTGDQLEAAKRTLFFSDGSLKPYETITFGTSTSKDVSMVLLDNEDQQGHMVVRLMLTIESSDAGYCYLTNGGDHTDIFIQDDESPVTSYILGVINEDADGEPFMEEISSNGALDHYEYQFAGLQVDYTQLTNLTLSYENRGTGDLEDIKVTVYDDREGKTVSSYFEAERPSETNLKQSLGGIGTVDIHPVANLEDGVYEGWVFLTAEHVEQPVKVKVRQVVGQSTLKGRIYITPEMMSLNVRTGVAKISIYDASTTSLQPDGTFDRPPVYTTESNEYGGEFEIPNILNKGSYSEGIYYVVVERDGFLTYNGRKYRQAPGRYTLKLGTTSATYTMNLRLIGGDVNGDQKVNDTDLNILISYYNRYSGMPDTDPAEEAIIKRCDFNQDGVVNALDRMFLLGNLGTTDADYPYESFLPIPADE